MKIYDKPEDYWGYVEHGFLVIVLGFLGILGIILGFPFALLSWIIYRFVNTEEPK